MLEHALTGRTRYPGLVNSNIGLGLIIDNITSKILTSDVSSATWEHINSGNLMYLCYCTNGQNDTDKTLFNGEQASRIITVSANSKRKAYIHRLKLPSIGTYNVSITGLTTGYFMGYCISLFSSNIDAPNNTPLTATGSSASPSISPQSNTRDIVIDIMVGAGDGGTVTITPGSSQTEAFKSESPSYAFGAGSHKTGIASYTPMGYTLGSSRTWGMCALAING